mmetsp:Transcript_21340/g.41205  ORF Transcript_21340/g.41205 Transcript_21340/m.41205 type:complete len:112 (-) Transcript_21340:225-560(-)
MEKAREFQSVIDDQMAVDDDSSFVEDETSGIVRRGGAGLGEEEEIGHNLDHEVVKTESKSWRDLKMNISGSARVLPNRSGPKRRGKNGAAASGKPRLESIPEPEKQETTFI